jgi:hypothetical protein
MMHRTGVQGFLKIPEDDQKKYCELACIREIRPLKRNEAANME